MKTVYLAGPITGLTYDGATNWRDDAINWLYERGIKGLSPMRDKYELRSIGEISGTGEEYAQLTPLATARGIMTRDFYDATTCDVLFVNFLGAQRVSIGTVMEVAWAFQKRTPVVCIIEDGNENIHSHMMMFEALGYRTSSIEEGLRIVEAILAPDPLRYTNATQAARKAA